MTETRNPLEKYAALPSEALLRVVSLPGIPRGELTRDLFTLYEQAKKPFGKNPFFRLQLRGDEIIGSTLQDAILMAQVVAEKGWRTALPRDFSNPRVLQMAKDKHYFDSVALILRGPTGKWYDERAKAFVQELEEQVDIFHLETEPALVTNLKIVPSNDLENGYGFRFIPLVENKFNVVYSTAFLSNKNGWRFNEQDKNGAPILLGPNKEDGSRVNYTSDSRVSRFCLDGGSSLDSDWGGFGDSSELGRVPLFFADEVGAKKISDVLQAQQKSELLQRLGETREHLADLERELGQ